MFAEDDLLPISALQHMVFCERQCALIHVERLWAENKLTVEGQHLHQRADEPSHKSRPGVRIARALPLRSLKLGLIGQADVVEFIKCGPNDQAPMVVPIEYKRGKPKREDSDRVQLCAQAMCLEEMCDVSIKEGAIFYGQRKRRTVVSFDGELRKKTVDVVQRLRQMIEERRTPPAIKFAGCRSCSLVELCLPDAMDQKRNAKSFFDRQLAIASGIDGPSCDDHGDAFRFDS
ncbi:CRISPR-associated protein Cas4 [Rhodopirellula sp. MGV]|uniref:CRISPR-associated protein Cas4 n=1 Tax=Rhodopirellula sp. MGV TaxID=2023130 RepID=UPI000B96EF50|nr:CRISPR-associated protein Cas4 [Rhodopirellula sp. MGV]OYP35566.1 CRISPR-associated protein Cas4 [Rhodopirellula sp. MGV]PNY34595.1 CRISPR-associated protein Cas4 [Rhodopirellula baltica]